MFGNAYVDPYGTANFIGTRTLALDMRLPGQSFQLEAGSLHQNGWRDYDPSLGRYIEVDPLGINAGQNIYAYVGGDPLNRIDPSGRFIVPIIVGAALGGGIDLAIQLYRYNGNLQCVNWWEVGGQAALGGLFGFGGELLAGLRAGAEVGAEGLELETAESWGKPDTLADHFRRHGGDFGATSEGDYAGQASKFLQRSQSEGLPTKIDANGTIRTYDPNTNTFGSYNANGTTKTFFKPDSPTFWGRQLGAPPGIIGGRR